MTLGLFGMVAGKVSGTACTSDRKTSPSLLRRQGFILDKSWRRSDHRKL